MLVSQLLPKHLFVLFFTASAQIGCAQEKDNAELYFSGLSSGVVVGENCVAFDTYAVHVVEADGELAFSVHKNATS
jgi:hypothetical protein